MAASSALEGPRDGTSPARPVLLSIEELGKRFEQTTAVDGVSLQIHRGEIFALLGGSGSGKSTLLRMLAGFESPTQGRILLEGQDISELAPYQRPINMMFQSYALFPHMTVEQNIAFGLKQDRLPKAEIAARVSEMLQLVHMEAYARRKPHQLSGGQRQRVALARSLAKRPQLLLLDEPMGALDKQLRTRMQLELVQIIQRVGVTCVMVTHDQEEAMTMAGRLAIMHQGRIAQVGTPMEIYESPASRQVCEFIGTVNLFEGEVGETAGSTLIDCGDLERPIRVAATGSLPAAGARITCALRPEKIHMRQQALDPADGDCNWTRGTVEEIAYLGGHSIYHVRLPSGLRVQAFAANHSRQSRGPLNGDPVYLHWQDDSVLVLES